jgi:dephospho-CoA kinase
MVGMPDTSRIVIGVAGRIGSGKSVVAHCLEREFGFQYLRYSMVLAEWYRTDPADKSRLQEVGEDVMFGGGRQRELNRRLIEQIDRSRDVVVDGLRHPIDHECLKTEFVARFFLIFVETPSVIRFERSRDRYDTFEEFLAADSRPVESHIDSLRSPAATTISGTMPVGEMTSELDLLTRSFRRRIGE